MAENTEQIRRQTNARVSGTIDAILSKWKEILFALVAAGTLFNGCKTSQNSTDLKNDVKWIGNHIQDKQEQIDKLKEKQ